MPIHGSDPKADGFDGDGVTHRSHSAEPVHDQSSHGVDVYVGEFHPEPLAHFLERCQAGR